MALGSDGIFRNQSYNVQCYGFCISLLNLSNETSAAGSYQECSLSIDPDMQEAQQECGMDACINRAVGFTLGIMSAAMKLIV